jgi:protease PrsW
MRSSSAGPVGRPAPGWYADPWALATWRWWDGHAWTSYVRTDQRKPRLPAWLSPAVLIGVALVVPGLVISLAFAPVATLLPLPSFLIVLAVFVWFDRLEPEPWQERIHAVLWGATVAIVVAGTLNGITAVLFGEVAAIVVSAPVGEEIMKGLGILAAVRRRKVDSVTDGVVYAGWVAAGFALVENVEYFALAAAEGALLPTVIARGVLAPFAHPLFTIWTGVFIGRAVVRGRNPVAGALPGLAIAIALHAAWNLTAVGAAGEAALSLLVIVAYVVLFAISAVVLVIGRLRGRTHFARSVPAVAARYGLTHDEVLVFSDWRRTLAVRRSLPPRQRRSFDARHAAIARLVALHRRPQPPDAAVEAQLVGSLWEARQAASRS